MMRSFLTLGGGLLLAAAALSAQAPRLEAGAPAPAFSVAAPDGRTLTPADFRGKLLLVDIWATWCGPCIAAQPKLSELAERYRDDLVILAVCSSDTRENYDRWVQRNGSRFRFQTAFDPAGRDWKASVFNTGYGVAGFPTLFLLDREGRLVGQTSGGGAGEHPELMRLLARGGLKVDAALLTGTSTAETVAATTPLLGGGMRPAGEPGARLGRIVAGTPLPAFALTAQDGTAISEAAFRDRVTILTFFSNLERGPEGYVVELWRELKAEGVGLVAVATAAEKEKFDAFVATAKPEYTAVWDPAGRAYLESVAHLSFGVGMFPGIAVVGPDGRLVGGYIGVGDRNAPLLKDLLGRAGVASLRPPAGAVPAARILPAPGAPAAVAPAAAPRRLLEAGAVAPDFTALRADGTEVRLSDFAGKIVLLDFWATWCGPCISAFPHNQALAARYRDEGVVVLAAGTSDTTANFRRWIPENGPRFPDVVFAYDPNERGSPTHDQRVSLRLYGVSLLPTLYVIGRDGRVVATVVGNSGEQDARIEAHLAGLGVKVDAERVAAGRAQLAQAEVEAKARAEKARAEAENPPPPFREAYGRLKAGETVPDVTVETPEGARISLASLGAGGPMILLTWGAARGPEADSLQAANGWAERYASKGLRVIGLAAYGSREDFEAWHAAHSATLRFPVVFDPAGAAPRPPRARSEMTAEEGEAFKAATQAHFGKVVPMQLSGGAMAPIPHAMVFDGGNRFLGLFVGPLARNSEAVGNLLLRAGFELEAADRPARIWTAAETAPRPPEPKVERLGVGALAPDFVTRDLEGREVRLSDYRGKVVVLDFWATWCGPCLAAMPHTQQVAAQYKDQGVVVLGSATSDTRAKFESWVRANATKYPDIVWSHDPAERAPERASRALYGVSGIPTQFVIDREGRIADVVVGYGEGEVILDAALAKAGIAVDPSVIARAEAQRKARN